MARSATLSTRVRSSSSSSAAAVLSTVLTRLWHQLGDVRTTAWFSLCPFHSWSTKLNLRTFDNKKVQLTIDQWTSLGSGGFVWGGARTLAQQLQTQTHTNGILAAATSALPSSTVSSKPSSAPGNSPWAGLNVIELGAGTGAMGISIAATLGANSVTLTDQASFVFPRYRNTRKTATTDNNKDKDKDKDALEQEQKEQEALKKRSLLDLIRNNVQNNLSTTSSSSQEATATTTTSTDIHICELIWGSDIININNNNNNNNNKLPYQTYDVIVASDVLVFQDGQEDLLATIRNLSTPQTVILIGHTDRGSNYNYTNNNDHNNDDDDDDDEGGMNMDYPNDLVHFFQLLDQDEEASWFPRVINNHGRYITLHLQKQGPEHKG